MRKVANILLVIYVVICGLLACFGHALGYSKNILIYFILLLIPGLSIYAVLYLIFGNKFEISKQFPFIKYHFKNTKNKIIFNIMICILIFICSFIYRPLELIIWNKLYFDDLDVKERKLIHAMVHNPDEFLELYKQYGNSKPDSEDIMRFVDNFNTDFLASSIFFFSESYLMAFMNKSKIYVNQYNNFAVYQRYNMIPIFQNTYDYFTFIDKNMKITKMLDGLSDEFSIMHAIIQMQFIFQAVHAQFMEQDGFCSLNTEYIMDAFMQNYNIIDKNKDNLEHSTKEIFDGMRNALKEAIDWCRK